MRKGAVLAAGTILTRGTPVFDLVNGEVLRATDDLPLIVPENAVVVPGSRAVNKGKGQEWGLSLYAAVDREIPRRQDRPERHARGSVAIGKRRAVNGQGSATSKRLKV